MQTGQSGVYAIRLVTTGQCYIGSTVRMSSRWWQHRHALKQGCHHSPHLQKAWNENGEAAFEFVILESIPPFRRNDFKDREQFYIDSYKSDFNYQREAYTKPGPWHHTDESKSRISHALKASETLRAHHEQRRGVKRPGVSAKLKGRKLTPEHVAKVAAAQRGVPRPQASLALKTSEKALAYHARMRGSKRSVETRLKLSVAAMGNQRGVGAVHSPESVERARQASLGSKRTAESREKMRQAQLARIAATGVTPIPPPWPKGVSRRQAKIDALYQFVRPPRIHPEDVLAGVI